MLKKQMQKVAKKQKIRNPAKKVKYKNNKFM